MLPVTMLYVPLIGSDAAALYHALVSSVDPQSEDSQSC